MTVETAETKVLPRLKARYAAEIKTALQEEFSYANVNQVPRLVKVVVNMGVGDAAKDSKLIDGAVKDLTGDHGPEAPGHQGPQVHRPVQAS
jgi:large subunit ribosomal protein L5